MIINGMIERFSSRIYYHDDDGDLVVLRHSDILCRYLRFLILRFRTMWSHVRRENSYEAIRHAYTKSDDDDGLVLLPRERRFHDDDFCTVRHSWDLDGLMENGYGNGYEIRLIGQNGTDGQIQTLFRFMTSTPNELAFSSWMGMLAESMLWIETGNE